MNRLFPFARHPFRLVLLLILAALLAACARGTQDVEAWVAEVRNRPAPPLDPLPVMQQFETFQYAAQPLRDPFSVPINDRRVASSGPRPDPNRRKEPLEAFPLDSLDMVGTLGAGDQRLALVMAPDKVVHRLRAGSHMGQNEGRVVTITEGAVDVIELVPDGAGGWTERRASIALDDK
ncbi:MAG: pilus assembly protein PilP [Xanthomonadaceae bacterium]|nr:pilus assembly protein PilP [Xanthomonadaceae bacterium]